jgi:hypothetical protein
VFILTSNMFGLAILSLGILGVIVSLLIANRRRFLIGISLSGLLVALGVFYVVDTSLRQWWTARRITQIQEKKPRESGCPEGPNDRDARPRPRADGNETRSR